MLLRRVWTDRDNVLVIVKPETVMAPGWVPALLDLEESEPRPVQPPSMGRVTVVPKLGGSIIITLVSLLELAARVVPSTPRRY